MSTAKILRKGISSLLNSNVINILAESTGNDKALNLLKANFTFTAAEIATAFQDSHIRAIAAISAGLVSPEQRQGFWQTLLKSKVDSELYQRIESDYLQAFAKDLSTDELSQFRKTAIEQCKKLAKCQLFKADNVEFTETELASFVTETGSFAITELVLAQISIPLDDTLRDFLSYKELLGQAILFFLHENLRNDKRMSRTLDALQRESLIVDVREIKTLVQSTEEKLNQAVAAKQFGKLAELGPKLEKLQKIESVTKSHYAQFLAFQENFASWTNLVTVQLSDIFTEMEKLHWKLEVIHDDVKQILDIVEQLMARADLSPQMKPRDEFTQYNSGSLELINKALRLSKQLSPSNPQFSRVAIGLGCVVSASGNLKQAEALLLQAHEQAQNNAELALSAYNLFEIQLRQAAYDKALPYLQEAIGINSELYALHDEHKYPIERILGAGSMGCVFLCRQRLKKTQKVIVKCFWETQKGSLDEIFQEPLLMADIAGEYVPALSNYGFVDKAKQERGYFVTEYCENAIDGEKWIKKHGNLDIKSGIAVGLQIAKALQIAHKMGIYHLDLKPANLLLSPSDKGLSVKVIDFGLAKVAKSLQQEMNLKQSKTGLSVLAQSVFWSFDYTPPEQQCCGGEPNAKSDVYAFGKTLYRLLTGEIPHTLHPKRLAKAPELFELLCDCVEWEVEKRPDVGSLIERFVSLSPKTIVSKKTVEKKVEAPQQVDNRTWWNQLEPGWKEMFRNAVGFVAEPSDSLLVTIIQVQKLGPCSNNISDLEPLRRLTNLQEFSCYCNNISDLEPLRQFTSLQKLNCRWNQISDLEPLSQLTNLQELNCNSNQISDLEPLRQLTNLQELNCNSNQISDLEPLRQLTNLQNLDCRSNKIGWLYLRKFKKAMPNCKVKGFFDE